MTALAISTTQYEPTQAHSSRRACTSQLMSRPPLPSRQALTAPTLSTRLDLPRHRSPRRSQTAPCRHVASLLVMPSLIDWPTQRVTRLPTTSLPDQTCQTSPASSHLCPTCHVKSRPTSARPTCHVTTSPALPGRLPRSNPAPSSTHQADFPSRLLTPQARPTYRDEPSRSRPTSLLLSDQPCPDHICGDLSSHPAPPRLQPSRLSNSRRTGPRPPVPTCPPSPMHVSPRLIQPTGHICSDRVVSVRTATGRLAICSPHQATSIPRHADFSSHARTGHRTPT